MNPPWLRREAVGSCVAAARKCPYCGGPVERIRRRPADRLLSFFYPVRRYRCFNLACRWEGILRRRRGEP